MDHVLASQGPLVQEVGAVAQVRFRHITGSASVPFYALLSDANRRDVTQQLSQLAFFSCSEINPTVVLVPKLEDLQTHLL